MYLSCCVYDNNYSIDFLFYSLRQIFLTLQNLKYIGYLISKTQEIDKNLCKNVPPRSYNGCNNNNQTNSTNDISHRNNSSGGNDEEKGNSAIQALSATKQRFFFNKCRNIEVEGNVNELLCSYSFWVCFRKDLVYIMKIRKARVEDCDDLVPMFKQKNVNNNE